MQGKKKKGSKKGSKKGKKGAGLSDAQPKLSVPERFIKFQLDTRAEVMGIWCVGSTISAGYWFCVNDHGQHPLCPSLPLPLARPNTIRHHIPLSPTTCPHPFPPALSTLLSRVLIRTDRRAEMFEKNDASRKKLERLKAKQQSIIQTLRSKSDADEKELASKVADGESRIGAAEISKKESLKSNEDTLASLRSELSDTEQRLKEENELLSVLEHHKHVLQAEWSSQIANLTQTITDLEEDFRAELNGLDRQFRMKTLQFEGDVDAKMVSIVRSARSSRTHARGVRGHLCCVFFLERVWLLISWGFRVELAHDARADVHNRLKQSETLRTKR